LSNIRAGTISGINGTDPVTLTKQVATKVWAKYDGNSVIADSFNVSSTTDGGTTGQTTVNITNALFFQAGKEYAVQATCNGTSGDRFATVAQQSATSYASYTYDGNVRTELPVGTIATGDLA